MSVSALEAIERRRSIRQYDQTYQIPQDILEKIMHAAQSSPTACDYQGCDFIVMTNREKMNKKKKVILDALPDTDFKKHFVDRRVRHGIKNVVTCDAPCFVIIVKNERADKDWVKVDAGIASMSIMIAAQNFGIESVCVGLVAVDDCRAQVDEFLGLKKDSTLVAVALGKPTGEIKLHDKVIKSKVIYDK